MSTDKLENYKKIGQKLLDEHVDLVSFSDLLQMGIEELDNTDPAKVCTFGYDFLDDKLTGIFPGELVVIGGESGTGKTTFATNIVYRASKERKCAIFALEDRLVDYSIKAIYFEVGRLLRQQGKKNYPWNAYRKNEIKDAEYKNIRAEACRNLANPNVYFEKVKKQMNIDMLEKAIRTQVEKGFELFLIDHLHYFDLTRGESTKADYVEQVMVRLKQIQNETGARVLLIVHYKKLGGTKPSIDSFKDSIAIVQNANYVINLWRDRSMQDKEENNHFVTQMFIPKSRNPNGECSFELVFNPDINDYEFKDVTFGTPLSDELQSKYASF